MSATVVRCWQSCDDASLTRILRAQLVEDSAWPPPYAHSQDLRAWLARPADLGRWVCTTENQVTGHIGLGSLTGEPAKEFAQGTGYSAHRFAEVCRTVVDPRKRRLGIAGILTRKALKVSLNLGRIPVATVLTGRGTWLDMMMATGWQRIGDVAARTPDERLVLLLAPQKFVDAAVTSGG